MVLIKRSGLAAVLMLLLLAIAKHFQEAVKADDKLAQAHYNLALALDQMGKHKEATEQFDHAAHLAPKDPAIAESPILKGHLKEMKKH